MLISSASLSNGESHIKEDQDQEEQGEKFEFDDEEDIGPPERSGWTIVHTQSTNLKTCTQETANQGVNGTNISGQKGPTCPLYHQHRSGEVWMYHDPDPKNVEMMRKT